MKRGKMPLPAVGYDPLSYWSDMHRRADLSSVGQSAYSAAWNGWLYRAWQTTGRRFLERQGVSARSVCEVGAGIGAWFPVWRSLGAEHITAIDLVDLDVPGDRVLQLDIGEPHDDIGTFDAVAAMYILLHITDDARFQVALNNLVQLVAPGGWLIIADPMRLSVSLSQPPVNESVVRPLEAYRFPGLRLEALTAATIIAGDPVERRSFVARAAFGLASRVGSRLPGILGPAIAALDPWLVAHTDWMPSAKLALYRRV